LLGVKWGDDAASAASRLGLRCTKWDPWEGGSGFEVCADNDRSVTIFGASATARLIRRSGHLDGIELSFRACGPYQAKLRDEVIAEFDLDSKAYDPDYDEVYQTWNDGSLVRLTHDAASDSCAFFVAGPQLGKVYQSGQLGEGLRGLQKGLRPH
jgi:hypothetical protein